MILEIRNMDNIVGGATFFWTFALIGITIALSAVVVLRVISPSVFFECNRRYAVTFGLLIGMFCLLPASASYMNHRSGAIVVVCREYKVVRKSKGGETGQSSWLFLKINDEEERFDVAATLWDEVSQGEVVNLCTSGGCWDTM